MKVKKIFVTILVVAFLLLSACQASPEAAQPQAEQDAASSSGAGEQASSDLKVGYSAAGLIDELQITWSEGVTGAIEAAGGMVLVVDSQNDIAKQTADIEDLLAQDIDYLVINPVDEAGIVPAIEAANEAGVPVITIDRAAGGGDVAVHVGFDNYKAGYDAGQYIAEMNGGEGAVAQLEGQAGTSVARERGQGFEDAIAEYPDMHIVFEQPTDWSASEGLSATEDLLTANPDVVGIWAHADAIIIGAVEALESAGKQDQVVTVGMGMYGGGPESIMAGKLNASWELFSSELGNIAGQAVVDMASGKSVEGNISTDMAFVTSENIDEFLVTDDTSEAAGESEVSLEDLKVGYSAAGLIDELQITWSEGVTGAIQAAGGTVLVVDSQNDIAKQTADIEDLLAQEIDYLVINPVDEAGIVPAIEAANEAGVPVITIDRAAGGGDVAVHVGFDNYKAGYDAGQYIAEMNGGEGAVAQLEGQAGTSVARERGQGFEDAIAEYPDMHIVFEQPTDWSASEGLSATEDLLTANPDVVGIWAHADAIIIGAVEALESAGKQDQVVTVGMGMYGGGPESIMAGKLNASWELFSSELGNIAGQAVVDMASGKSVESNISTDMAFVTSENIDEFLK